MSTITLENAQSRLGELIAHLAPGEEILIADRGEPVARLVRTERVSWPCRAGSAKDVIQWISPDFDAPLEDFSEYMQ